ncbi:MAG: hypothetical protein Q4C34_05805 [Bacteroidales bacterium]|nr:hypothetical protein [Bacteroidales bacterium]
MRKLLFLLVGVLVAFAANAQTYVKVPGAHNKWDQFNGGIQPDANGIAKHENLKIGTGEFKILIWDGSSNAWYSTGNAIAQNEWIKINGDNNNMTIAGATDNQEFNVEWNTNTNEIRVTPVGGQPVEKTYKLKGTFTNNWNLVDLPYEHTFDGTQGEQKYGLDCNGEFYSGGTTFNGTAVSYKIEGNNGDDKIAANYKGKVRFEVKDGTLYVTAVNDQPVEKTYKLKGTFTNNWSLVDLPYEHTFDGTQGEQKYGLDCNGEFYSGGTTFNGTAVSYKIEGNNGDDKIAANYKGKVRFEVKDGTLYVTAVGGDEPQPIVEKAFYMNFGQDFPFYRKDTNTKAFIQFVYFGSDQDYYSGLKEMTNTTNGKEFVYRYEYNDDEIKNLKDVKFCFETKEVQDGNNVKKFYSALDGGDWDKSRLADYVYFADFVDGTGAIARQSYITYKQARGVRAGGIKELYVTGDRIDAKDANIQNSETKGLNWNPATPMVLTHDDGVFFFEVTHKGQDGDIYPQFKISYLNPTEWHDLNYGANDKPTEKRLWATFNMALIGIDAESQWVNKEGNNSDISYVNGVNGYTRFTVRRSLPYNYYNQYDWRLEPGFGNIDKLENNHGWIVIDTHEECQTLTLISFDPMPSVNISGNDVETLEIGYENGVLVHDGNADHFKACGKNGHIYFSTVNKASAKVTVKAASESMVTDANFTVVYDIMQNGEVVSRINGVPTNLDVDYIALGDQIPVAVRAKYTDNTTKLSFHSHTSAGTIETDVKLAAPTLGSNAHKYYWGGVEGNKHNINAALMLDYTKPESNLVSYADYSVVANGEEVEAAICDENLQWVKEDDQMFYLGQNINEYNWTRPNDGDSYSDKNNWAKIISEHKTMPIYVEGVHQVEDIANVPASEFHVTGYAVYPFLVNSNAQVNAQKAGARRAAARIEDYSKFNVVNIAVPTEGSMPITISAGAVTGIEDIVAEADGEAEFYTLQGVRVEGELVPGVYIRRQGNTASKVYIR